MGLGKLNEDLLLEKKLFSDHNTKGVWLPDLIKGGLTDRVVSDTKSVLVGLQLTEH